jgi:hypothetical protein
VAKLLFDVDSSLASLGTAAQVTEMCGGIEPISIGTDGLVTVMEVINNLFVAQHVVRAHPVITGANIKETVVVPSPKAVEYKVDCLIVDTYSHLQRNDLRLLEQARPTKQMEIQDWGVIERMYNLSLNLIKRLPIPVVINCHSTTDRDQMGNFQYNAALKGKAGEFINEYFDLVLYTQTAKAKDGTYVFNWLTKPDAMRKAKDRLNLLPPIVPQDFEKVLKVYADAGYKAPKILVIGESGTGKTRALATLPKTIL